MSTLLTYMYRDAHNYKRHGEVVVSNPDGLCVSQARKRIQASLDEGQYFIAEQLGLPVVFPWKDAKAPADFNIEYDHPWHEFVALEACKLPATVDVTLRQVVARAERAKRRGWIIPKSGDDPSENKIKLFHSVVDRLLAKGLGMDIEMEAS